MNKQAHIKQAHILTLAAALLGLTGAAFAQTSGLNTADQTYLTQNAQGSVSDYATAAVAVQKAQSKDVRGYAAEVYNDHNKLDMQLLDLAHNKNVSLPVTLSDEDKAKLDTLTALSGPDFDKAFLQQEVQTNGQDVTQARTELTTTTDPDTRKFVTAFLNTEQKHLDRAQALMNAMSASAK